MSSKSQQTSSFDTNDLNVQLSLRRSRNEDSQLCKSSVFATSMNNPPTISLADTATILRCCETATSGSDKIPSIIIRDFRDILATISHFIWSLSLKHSGFPNYYKRANLICVPKTTDFQGVEDLRSIVFQLQSS